MHNTTPISRHYYNPTPAQQEAARRAAGELRRRVREARHTRAVVEALLHLNQARGAAR